MFNGVDLTGWEPYGTEKWYVKDGLLVCESGPDKQYGYLATRDYYDDFDLTVEFKQEADVQTWLNGQEMVNLNDEKIGAGKGRIALQIHDGGGIKVLWRNLKLTTL